MQNNGQNRQSGPRGMVPLAAQGLTAVALALFLFFYLQATQEFTYFYREQNQLFLFDSDYIGRMAGAIGGVNKALTQLLVQLFVLPRLGALVSALLSLTGALFLWMGLRRVRAGSWGLMALAFVPSMGYNLYLLDNYARYEGLVALTLMSILFGLYTLSDRQPVWLRLACAAVGALLLFYGAGSVAVLFALAVLTYEAVRRIRQAGWFLLPLGLVVAAGIWAVRQAQIAEYGQALWMRGYVEYYFALTRFYHLAWISVPIVILLTALGGRLKPSREWIQAGMAVLLAILLPAGYAFLSKKHQDRNMYHMEQVIYLAEHKQWDRLLSLPADRTNNLISMNYLNMALSAKGELLDKLFLIPQANRSQSLFLDYQQYTDIGILRAKTYYLMGVIGASQMMAVSASMSVSDGCPDMTRLIIKNYLITGRYNIAERYIRRLEKTWYYDEWATSMRKFLYNDEAVENDPELGRKRRDLPKNSEYFAIYAGMLNDALTVLEANPRETHAKDYAIAYMLLEKNFDLIKPFVEYNYGKPWLLELPVRLQEAVIAYSEKDMDYCRRYGVSEEVITRFAAFRQQALQLRHQGRSSSALAPTFGNTFWYYMLKP